MEEDGGKRKGRGREKRERGGYPSWGEVGSWC